MKRTNKERNENDFILNVIYNMKRFDEKIELLAMVTSPVVWVLAIAVLIWKAIEIPWKYIGLSDWYFVYFKMEKMADEKVLKDTAAFCWRRTKKCKTMYTKWRFTKGALKAESLL